MLSKKLRYTLLALLVCSFTLPDAHAQGTTANVDILPAASISGNNMQMEANNPTHPPIRLTPDKSEIVRLDRDAATIIIGNPTHASVLADSTKTLIIVPKTPGATYFTALDKDGEVIMQRHIIVAAPKEKYIRIRRSCATAAAGECQSTHIYYCPDICHEITINADEGKTSAGAQNLANGAGDMNAAMGETSSESAPLKVSPP